MFYRKLLKVFVNRPNLTESNVMSQIYFDLAIEVRSFEFYCIMYQTVRELIWFTICSHWGDQY